MVSCTVDFALNQSKVTMSQSDRAESACTQIAHRRDDACEPAEMTLVDRPSDLLIRGPETVLKRQFWTFMIDSTKQSHTYKRYMCLNFHNSHLFNKNYFHPPFPIDSGGIHPGFPRMFILWRSFPVGIQPINNIYQFIGLV